MGDIAREKSPIQSWYRGFLGLPERMITLVHIIKVTVREHYRLEVLLDNATIVILNMMPRLNSVRFMALKEQALFEKATTDGQYIRWGSQVEISLSEVFHLAQK